MADHTLHPESGSTTDDAMSSAEFAAMTFPAVETEFNWSNDEWALAHLPKVRIASLLLQRDDVGLADTIGKMTKAGIVPEMLDGLCVTKDHLEALVKLLETAITRSFVVLERAGFSPDFPPSEHAVQ